MKKFNLLTRIGCGLDDYITRWYWIGYRVVVFKTHEHPTHLYFEKKKMNFLLTYSNLRTRAKLPQPASSLQSRSEPKIRFYFSQLSPVQIRTNLPAFLVFFMHGCTDFLFIFSLILIFCVSCCWHFHLCMLISTLPLNFRKLHLCFVLQPCLSNWPLVGFSILCITFVIS